MTHPLNFELLYGVIGVAVSSTIFVHAWTWAANAERFQRYRLRPSVADPLAKVSKKGRIMSIIAFDISLYSAYLLLAHDWLIKDGTADLPTVIAQILAVLVVYDFLFYWVHRLFHTRFLMRHVHAVHHRVRSPKAVDDFYLHPVDSIWVTTLLFGSIAFVGPLSTNAFVATLFAYVFINNTLHSGLNFPHPVFRLTNYWARKHEVHHGEKLSANFASIFPIWDMAFGTAWPRNHKDGSRRLAGQKAS